MPQTKLDSEEFQTLLSEALRAGPDSEPWHAAIRVIRSQNVEVEEYALLCRAREVLEQGKGYRAVRPGPRFTQKVLNSIDDETENRAVKGIPWANVIAILSAGVILGVAGTIAYFALSGT